MVVSRRGFIKTGSTAVLLFALFGIDVPRIGQDSDKPLFTQPPLPGIEQDILDYYTSHEKEVDFWIKDVWSMEDEQSFFVNTKTWEKVPINGKVYLPAGDSTKEMSKKVFKKSFRDNLRYIRGRKSLVEYCLAYWPMYKPMLEGAFRPSNRQFFAKFNVPIQLASLPMSETQLRHKAISWADAYGLWQFLLPTGKKFGLNTDENPLNEERFDLTKSTEAAYAHFSDAFNVLLDWKLVLSTYILGERRTFYDLEDALRKAGKISDDVKPEISYNKYFENMLNKAKDDRGIKPINFFDYFEVQNRNFDEIYELFKEVQGKKNRFSTEQYVNRFVAYWVAAHNPEEAGFGYLDFKKPVEVKEYQVDGGLSLRELADYAGIDFKVLEMFNSNYVFGVTPFTDNGETFTLRLPKSQANTQLLASIPEEVKQKLRTKIVEYLVRSGDTIAEIAEQLDVDHNSIILPDGRSKNLIFPGEKLPVIFK